MGVVSIDSLSESGRKVEAAATPLVVDAQAPLGELLSHVGGRPARCRLSMKEHQYVGIISKRMLLRALVREGNNG